MNLFFDTSALIKKYILEKGSDKVLELLDNADTVIISSLLEFETISMLKDCSLKKLSL